MFNVIEQRSKNQKAIIKLDVPYEMLPIMRKGRTGEKDLGSHNDTQYNKTVQAL